MKHVEWNMKHSLCETKIDKPCNKLVIKNKWNPTTFGEVMWIKGSSFFLPVQHPIDT